MAGIALFIFIIIFFMKHNSGNKRMRSIRKQLDNSSIYKNAAVPDAEAAEITAGGRKSSGYGGFGKPYRGRVKQTAAGHMHLKDNNGLALEDREHDWLAMQLKEEARMKRSIDTEMYALKEEHRRAHRRLNNA